MTFILKLTKDDFITEFKNWEQNKFSIEALKLIYDIETDMHEENSLIKLDKTVIYTSYHEYENEQELLDDYKGCDTILDIENNTTVWRISDSGGLLINPF